MNDLRRSEQGGGVVGDPSGLRERWALIWLGITRDDVLACSPPLADKFALDADAGSDEVVARVVEAIRPSVACGSGGLDFSAKLLGLPESADELVSRVTATEFLRHFYEHRDQ